MIGLNQGAPVTPKEAAILAAEQASANGDQAAAEAHARTNGHGEKAAEAPDPEVREDHAPGSQDATETPPADVDLAEPDPAIASATRLAALGRDVDDLELPKIEKWLVDEAEGWQKLAPMAHDLAMSDKVKVLLDSGYRDAETWVALADELAQRRRATRNGGRKSKARSSTADDAAAQADDVDLDQDLCVSFADIEAKPVKWVWERWIPAGMVSILFGLSGLGKSHLYVDITGHISHGTAFPDGSPAPQGNAVIMSAEDAPDSVLKPRLEFAGADCSRIFHFPSVAKFDGKGKRVFSLVEDCEILKRNIIRHNAVFAVVDPITAYLSGVESHVATEVRAALALIDEVAQSTGVAILCIMHPNKNTSGDMKAVQRLSGSGAFGDAPRCVMLVAEDPERKEEKRRLLLPAKMNLGLWPDGMGYRIVADGPLTCSSGVAWDNDPVTISADDAMAPRRAPAPATQAAIDFLKVALADGEWHPARDLIDEAAERHHINKRTLERAIKTMAKVVTRKSGFQGGYEWRLETEP